MAPAVEVDENVLVKFAQKLAGNEKKFRDRALKKLRKWLGSRPKGAFTEEDMMKIWKGLHYCMWMSDKPLVQEELAESLAGLTSCFTDNEQALLFIKVFYATEAREWHGIDRLRLDKFMMLIRRVTRHSLVFLKKLDWENDYSTRVVDILNESINADMFSMPDGIRFHLADIYIEEIERVSDGELTEEQFSTFLQPYVIFLSQCRNKALFNHVIKRIFFRLIDYVYEEDDDEDDDGDQDDEVSFKERSDAKDTITRMEIDYSKLADRLFEKAGSKDCYAKNRKDIYSLVKTFRDLAAGKLPEDKEITVNMDDDIYNVESAIARLQRFENSQLLDSCRNRVNDDPANKNNKKKKKKSQDDPAEDEPPTKKKKLENSIKNDKVVEKKFQTKSTVESGVSAKNKKKRKRDEMLNVNEAEPVAPKKKLGKKKAKKLVNGIDSTELDSELGSVEQSESEHRSNETKKDKSKKSKKRNLESVTEVNVDKVKTVKEKKKKKSKKKTVNLDTSSTFNSEEVDTAGKKSAFSVLKTASDNGLDSDVAVSTPTVAKKKKKKNKKLNSSAVSQTETPDKCQTESETDVSNTPVNSSAKKKKAKKSPESELADGELEIFVANKKYKGPLKEAFHAQMVKSLGETSSKKASTPTKPFASFENVKTPIAFVKKALLKVSPKTEPKHPKPEAKLAAPSSEPNKKRRVSFIMSRNVAQEFQDSLNVSPVLPFNPALRPEKGLLKSPCTPNVVSPSIVAKLRRRSKAADFF